jgi:hypothetical protein
LNRGYTNKDSDPERRLAEIWSDSCGSSRWSPHDDFLARQARTIELRILEQIERSGSTNAETVIRVEVQRFAALARPWEWKHYSYDEPADLPGRLRAAGFVPEPAIEPDGP